MTINIKFGRAALCLVTLALLTGSIEAIQAQTINTNPYMGAPVELTKAPNGAIA